MMKKIYIVATLMLALCGFSGTLAQTPLTPNDDKTVWTIDAMPAYDVELQVEYYTDLLETTDNSEWLTNNNGEDASVWLGRTLQPGCYNSFALPFSMDIPAGWKVKELIGSSYESATGTLTLNFTSASTIEAGKPYLVMLDDNSDAVTLKGYDNVTIGAALPNTTTDAVNFIPTFGKTLVTGPEGDEDNPKAVLYLGANNTLHVANVVNTSSNNASYMKGYRAYFQLKGESGALLARGYSLDFDDGEATGVKPIYNAASEEARKDGTYTLDGRPVSGQPTVKGVYIKNGMKTVME